MTAVSGRSGFGVGSLARSFPRQTSISPNRAIGS